MRAFNARRWAMDSALQYPCFQALRLPFGAPGVLPPCIRHLPFGIAGERQGVPFLVRAPQRGLR